MFKNIAIAVMSCLLFSGCASVPMADKGQDQAFKSFASPAANKSGIYIYRNTFAGQALKKSVSIDGTLIGESANKVYFYVEADPGEHKLSTESEFSDNDLLLKTEAGKNYFVEQYIKMGFFVGGANLRVVSDDEGKKGVQECSLANSNLTPSAKKAGVTSARAVGPALGSPQAHNANIEDMRHLYRAEKVATSMGCSSTTFVSSGPGVETYSATCDSKQLAIHCDFERCTAQ